MADSTNGELGREIGALQADVASCKLAMTDIRHEIGDIRRDLMMRMDTGFEEVIKRMPTKCEAHDVEITALKADKHDITKGILSAHGRINKLLILIVVSILIPMLGILFVLWKQSQAG